MSAALHSMKEALPAARRALQAPAAPVAEDRIGPRIALLAEGPWAAQLAADLSAEGYVVAQGAALRGLLEDLARPATRPDLLLMDAHGRAAVALPQVNELRRVSDLPCMVLRAGSEEAGRVLLLDAGADDCLGIETGRQEVQARLRALLRRSAVRPVAAAGPRLLLDLGAGWRLCRQRRDLYRPDGDRCRLTTAEFDLLDALASQAGTPVSREDLCRSVFRRRHWAEDRSVDNLVVRLRRKLEPDRRRPEVIRSIRPIGYMFAGFPEAAPR